MCYNGITQFYLSPTHEPYVPLLPAATPFGWYSLRLPTTGWPGWVDLGGWSYTDINVPHRELNPDTVTHPNTNRTRRRVTSLMCATPLPLSQAATCHETIEVTLLYIQEPAIHIRTVLFRLQKTLAVQRTCQPLESYKSMTSSRWRVILRTAATGRQTWNGLVQIYVTTSPMTSSPWQPTTRRLRHSWRLQHLLVYTALRLFVLLTLLNRHHLWAPLLLTYRVTRSPGRHRSSS